MPKHFKPLMATIWNKCFWRNVCPVENRNLWPPPSSPIQSAITRKREVLQPNVLIFFLISSTFSISSATANMVISRWKSFRGDPKKSLFRYIYGLVTKYQIWHSWALAILWFFSFWIKKFYQIWHSWAIIPLWVLFLNNIFFIFLFSFFILFYFLFLLFLFVFHWQQWAIIVMSKC